MHGLALLFILLSIILVLFGGFRMRAALKRLSRLEQQSQNKLLALYTREENRD